MKLTSTVIPALLATSASAVLDKWAPWGKRDYACINAYSGPTDNSTIAPNWPIEMRFNRNSGRCDASLNHYPTAEYSLWLHNNPTRQPAGFVTSEYQVKLQDGIPADAGSVTFELPNDLPEVGDDSVWYLRLNTYLPTAPQMPSLFNALGPFRLVR